MARILIIDDEQSIRSTLREILEYEKYTIDEAKDGEVLELGKIKIKVLHTPGHTMESSCFLLFDENGKEMKRPFLMAPVKYSRISSGFSGRRFHPVQKSLTRS